MVFLSSFHLFFKCWSSSCFTCVQTHLFAHEVDKFRTKGKHCITCITRALSMDRDKILLFSSARPAMVFLRSISFKTNFSSALSNSNFKPDVKEGFDLFFKSEDLHFCRTLCCVVSLPLLVSTASFCCCWASCSWWRRDTSMTCCWVVSSSFDWYSANFSLKH